MSIVKDFDIYIPNEIFNDLMSEDGLKQVHRPFAYCYYYLCNYLYRYCKYFDSDGNKVTQEKIKEMLGYASTCKPINYVIKKDGILDKLGYTSTTNDYPLQWGVENGRVFFLTAKELGKSDFVLSDRNFKVKKPIKAFYRCEEDQKANYLSGTFYEVMNTHRIPFAYFLEFMANDLLGVVGFYIYAFLKYKTDTHRGEYQASYIQLERELSLSDSTVKRYIKNLEDHSFIEVDHKPFDKNLKEEEREANIYQIT